MKVLIVDDQKDSICGIIDFCQDEGWEVELSDFQDCYKFIFEFDPDVVILDWREDADEIDIGKGILENIWINGYRPIILFSANVDIIDVEKMREESNLLKVISKGDEKPVTDELREIEKYVVSLSSFRKDMSRALIQSLNSVEYLRQQNDVRENAVSYILSKRASGFFEERYTDNIEPYWVQYVCPPISEYLCVCDVIRVVSEEGEIDKEGLTNEYRVILTPSCDMVMSEERQPKVSHVLCAYCESKEKFHGMPLEANPSSGKIKKVVSNLNLGYKDRYVPLPMLPQIIPYMSVDLKHVELIPIDEIATSLKNTTQATKYYRVASICSPYREQIVWAHLQNSCRPGVPDRNMENWAKDMLTK